MGDANLNHDEEEPHTEAGIKESTDAEPQENAAGEDEADAALFAAGNCLLKKVQASSTEHLKKGQPRYVDLIAVSALSSNE